MKRRIHPEKYEKKRAVGGGRGGGGGRRKVRKMKCLGILTYRQQRRVTPGRTNTFRNTRLRTISGRTKVMKSQTNKALSFRHAQRTVHREDAREGRIIMDKQKLSIGRRGKI